MRHLLQPRVLNLASLAAALSALACYPRLTLWSSYAIPIWYLLVMIFLCSIILWGGCLCVAYAIHPATGLHLQA
jgi:hypothetical protein